MKKWLQLKNIRDELAGERISEAEALDRLRNAVEIYSKSSICIEYKVFVSEIHKLKILLERMNALSEENKNLENYNNMLLHYALMSDEDFKKNEKRILKML